MLSPEMLVALEADAEKLRALTERVQASHYGDGGMLMLDNDTEEFVEDRQMTLGEYRVGITFNPGGNKMVDQIKKQAAALIDLVETIKSDDDEVIRLKSIAVEHFEDAAMWAVKACTKPMR
jgi:hypothetical protein